MRQALRWASGLLAVMMAFVLLVSVQPAEAASSMVFTQHPIAKTAAAGDTLTFSFKASGYKSVAWHLISPDGTDIHAKEIPTQFPGAKVTGANGGKLTIKKVTAEMDGWQVYVILYKKGLDPVSSEPALITVTATAATPQPTAAAEADGTDAGETAEDTEPTFSDESVDGKKTITAVNCTFSHNKDTKLTTLSFDEGVSVNVKFTASKTPAYWVINGTRYDFKPVPRTISVWGMRRNLTVEAVMKGKKSTTLMSDEEIQAQRTGETLKVSVGSSANLCHITSSGVGKGGWFGSLDFTQDFTNRATKKTETGGRVTVRVKAVIPEGKGVSGFKFMGATWNFNTNVQSFVVKNLRQSMKFEAEYYDLKQLTITCSNCFMSCKDVNGNQLSNVTSATVWEGTSLHIVGNGSGDGHWEGLKSSETVSNHNLRMTAHKSGTITWVSD